jgi:hypothetical protein
MPTVTRRRVIAAVVALVCVAVILFCWLLSAGPRITILNPRFQVTLVRVSRGTNHWIYDGNQVEGQIRYFLNGVGLPVKVPGRSGGHSQKDVPTFIVRYSSDLESDELVHLRADLIDAHGATTALRWTSNFRDKGGQNYLAFWVLDSQPAKGGRYKLRLRMATKDEDLAEIELKL